MSASFTKQSATAVRRRVVRWLWPAALLALTPKCVLCVLAYAGLGAVLGLGGGPELCGAPAVSSGDWLSVLAWIGLAGGVIALALLVRCRRRRA